MQLESNQTNAILIAQAVAGDRESLGLLLLRHHTFLTSLARGQLYQRIQSKADVSDLIQETYLEAQRKIRAFRGGSDSEFASWLRCILARTLSQHLRRYLGTHQRDVRLEESLAMSMENVSTPLQNSVVDKMNSPEEQLICSETGLAIRTSLDAIPDIYRQVILLRYVQGLSYREIAGHIGRTPDSVEKLLVRGQKKLKQVLVATLGATFFQDNK